jgi:hypothetical protein
MRQRLFLVPEYCRRHVEGVKAIFLLTSGYYLFDVLDERRMPSRQAYGFHVSTQ